MFKKVIFGTVIFAALFWMAMTAAAAHASTTVQWTGNGSENLPCPNGGHWILSPAQGITSATLTTNGNTQTQMHQNGNGSFAADSSGALDVDATAYATYEGDNDTAFLKLSHCNGGTPTPPPTTTTPPPTTTIPPPTTTTPPPTSETTPPTTPPTTHTNTPPTRTTTTPPPRGHHGPNGPRNASSTAFTGGNVALPVGIGAALLALGLGASFLARRKSRESV